MQLTAQHQRGVSLIESLIAMVILAFAMMSLAGMQARLLVDSRIANVRAIAVGQIDDITNRMIMNRNEALAGTYNLAWGAVKALPNCTNNGSQNTMGTCTASQLAQADLFEWRTRLLASIPSANATIFQSSTDMRQIGVAIAWPANESRAASAGASKFTLTGVMNGVDCPATFICHLVYVQP